MFLRKSAIYRRISIWGFNLCLLEITQMSECTPGVITHCGLFANLIDKKRLKFTKRLVSSMKKTQ